MHSVAAVLLCDVWLCACWFGARWLSLPLMLSEADVDRKLQYDHVSLIELICIHHYGRYGIHDT